LLLLFAFALAAAFAASAPIQTFTALHAGKGNLVLGALENTVNQRSRVNLDFTAAGYAVNRHFHFLFLRSL
jgi:hypothetical protein